jgi:hypothetical protein
MVEFHRKLVNTVELILTPLLRTSEYVQLQYLVGTIIP